MKLLNKISGSMIVALIALSFVLTGCKEEAETSNKVEQKAENSAPEQAVEVAPADSEALKALPEVVATVNGVDLMKSDLEKIYSMISAQAKMSGEAKSDKEVIEVALGELLNMEVLKQESKRRNIVPSAEDVENEMKNVRANFPDDEAFNETLKSKGLTIDVVKKSIEEQLAVQKVLEKEVEAKVAISGDEIKEFYAANPDYFKTKAAVKASHILVKTEEGDDEKKVVEARKKIDSILERAKSGEDFAKLAKETSEGPSAPNGGDLGYFGKGQMVKPFEDAVYKLKVGEVSDVVQTQFGFHIIKLYDVRDAGMTPLAEVEDSIKMFLSRQKGEKVFKQFVEKLRSGASIEKKI